MLVHGKPIEFDSAFPQISASWRAVFKGFFADSFSGCLEVSAVEEIISELNISVDRLMEALLPVSAAFAVVPVSNFPVGAISRGLSGKLHFGTNIEFPGEALDFTIHAEQASIANAIAKQERGLTSLAVTAPPCGHCRQFICELVNSSDLVVLISGKQAAAFSSFLPDSFGGRDLGIQDGLMSRQSHDLRLEVASQDSLKLEALKTADRSYAPYTGCFSGVALETTNGQVFSGSYAENAAYNPSMSPLGATLAQLATSGNCFESISRAVLVQARKAKSSQAEAARSLLKSISTVPLTVEYALAGTDHE